jgi:hypothetical protein
VTSGVPSAGVLCDECGALNTTGSERCIYCDACLNGRPRGISVLTLSWPWGDEEVRDTLVVGRDPPAPPALIARLAEGRFDNVSRQHAKFVVADGKASVVDMGSSNGTFVNGIRLRPNVPAELASGAKLRFGSDLEISVQLIS